MGEIFRPNDVAKGRRRMMEEATRDLTPGMRDAVMQILESWGGEESEDQLRRLLGKEDATRLLHRFRDLKKDE